MTPTKKFPVSVSYAEFNTNSSEFIVPIITGEGCCFIGIKSGKKYSYGAVSYIGKEISEKEVFAKLVDSGRKIESVDQALAMLTAYIQQLQGFKIGNIIAVVLKSDAPGFELIKVAELAKSESIPIP